MKTFSSRFHRNEHFLVHTTDRPFSCQVAQCQRSFKSKRAAYRHFQKVHLRKGRKTWKNCSYCDYSTCASLTPHVSSSHDFANATKVFKCRACPALFSNMKSRGMHTKRAHPNAALHTCALGCGFESENPKTNEDHEVKAHLDGPDAMVCRLCEIVFTNSRLLTNHLKRKHSVEEPWVCLECPYRTGDTTSLRAHVRDVHEPALGARCGTCGCKVAAGNKLRYHLTLAHSRDDVVLKDMGVWKPLAYTPKRLLVWWGGEGTPVVQVVDDDKGNLSLSQVVISPAGQVSSTVARDLALQFKTITAKGQVMLSSAKAFSVLSTNRKIANTSQFKLSTKANETNPKHPFMCCTRPTGSRRSPATSVCIRKRTFRAS